MELLKKPFIAFFLAVLIIIGSTLLSVNIKLGNKSQDVIDLFYDGVNYDGQFHESIASQLRLICDALDRSVVIADKYGLTTEDAVAYLSSLKSAFKYSDSEISYLYCCYSDLAQEADNLIDLLRRASISSEDLAEVERYAAVIDTANENIKNAGYNEAVREFLREYGRPSSSLFKELAGVEYPQYFA